MTLDSLFQQLEGCEIPPLERWDPPFCGEMNLRITGDGDWLHEGSPIRRAPLRQLLSRVLRREGDGAYYLVTPAEKLRIQVEDLPLQILDADPVSDHTTAESATIWRMTTAEGDHVFLGRHHRLWLLADTAGVERPAVPIRHGLEARLHRNVFYRLIDQAVIRDDELGLWSDGVWQPLGRLDESSS
ncbi:DUF1285 domain-containing protein [Salinicola avicenniae]|uniref:DUF1285 domain-containing protein n=1 Tax=Salinicola avicenniae TaxID=2916836 RepID=UPI0020731353|nr:MULTISPECIES: DUF1285 domain-containing protein [unclassified Salinicola]